MKAVVQRVLEASVTVKKETVGQIGHGLLIYLGVQKGDTNDDLVWMAEKILKLRIFPDSEEKMQYAITDVAGGVLVVSQFTLCADLGKGNRPGFQEAALPAEAKPVVDAFSTYIAEKGVPVQNGIFGAMMHVSSINDGPVTIILDSRAKLA